MPAMFGGTPEETWLRRETESDPAFEAFDTYMQMGLQRSLVKAAEKLGKSRQVLEEWSRKHEWRRRVTDWDRHSSREINRELLAGRAQMMKRHANVAAMIGARAAERIVNMTPADIAALTPVQAALIFRVSSEIEAKMRLVTDDDGETQPFQVVVNIMPDRADDSDLLQTAMRPPEPGSTGLVLSNVIRG